jgi:hypothetical protein
MKFILKIAATYTTFLYFFQNCFLSCPEPENAVIQMETGGHSSTRRGQLKHLQQPTCPIVLPTPSSPPPSLPFTPLSHTCLHHCNAIATMDVNNCIAGNRTWQYRLPQSHIIMYSLFIGHTATVRKIKKMSSSEPGLSVMTLCECRVDRSFPVT